VLKKKRLKIPLKIAIDARKLGRSGIGIYLKNIIKELSKLDAFNQYLLLINKGVDLDMVGDLPKNFELLNIKSKIFSIFEHIELPVVFKRRGIDLFHSPHFFLPFIKNTKWLTTIHDLIPLLFSKDFSFIKRLYLSKMIKWSILKSDFIIAVSNNTRNDILTSFGMKIEKKIKVIYEAANRRLIKAGDNEEAHPIDVFKKYRMKPGNYILFVGPDKKHKNVERIIEAFRRIGVNEKCPLVWVGDVKKQAQKIAAHENIILTGIISDEELDCLYRYSKVVVFPSLYEGFGLPILEAMACGVPVITSNLSSMAEVVGDAALLVNPYSIDEIAQALQKVLNDRILRKSLIEKGFKRVEQFSWKKAAEKTLEVYKAVCQQSV
jgi:glycosyltransferase involved in cell wall biosynthesis